MPIQPTKTEKPVRNARAGFLTKSKGKPKGIDGGTEKWDNTEANKLSSMCRFYSIIHEEPEGGYSAEVPALPGCYTDGDTIEEVKANLREAIQLYLEVSEGDRENLPAGSRVLEVSV